MAGVDLKDLKRRMDGAVEAFKKELAALRTGRASGNLLDPVLVDAYGSKVPLNTVANITVPEPRMLAVNVWDKTMVAAVEKAIRASNLGFNPITDGQSLRLPMPDLNEERRKELVKLAGTYSENAKVTIRHVRRDGMDGLKKAEKDGDLGKDDAHSQSENVQKATDDMIKDIDGLLADKEKEIMTV